MYDDRVGHWWGGDMTDMTEEVIVSKNAWFFWNNLKYMYIIIHMFYILLNR